MSAEAAPLLYREIARLAAHPEWGPAGRVAALAALLERLFVEATRQEQLAFSTLFARISYAGHKFGMQAETLQAIHTFRRLALRARQGQAAVGEREMRLGVKALAETVLIFYQSAIPPEVLTLLPAPGEWQFEPPEAWEYKARARVVALRDDPEQHCLIALDEEAPARPVRVHYNLPERNANFNPTIRLLRQVFGFPATLNLLDVDVDRDGDYRPRVFVVEPDYLVDVSAVAECFKDTGAEPLSYLVKKFLPHETTAPILLGNIANFFLDRLLHEPGSRWEDLIRETFQLYPFVFAPMSDAEVRDLTGKAQKHFVNLKTMAAGGFAQQGILPEDCVLEPTFFSEQYGLQGRLDLFYHTEERSAIVELKSGMPFKPNSYGISRSHFTQTLLYDLLVRSVFGRQTDPAKYILYSGESEKPLRFAPTVPPEQWEALQVRNHLVGIERLLAATRPGDELVPLLARLSAAGVREGFLKKDIARFEEVYNGLNALEKKYFNAFAGFIAREHWLAKVGEEDADSVNGHAALWRSSFADKQQAFAILSHLEIADNRADQPEPCIVFHKTAQTNPLANFRVGDIAVLYPAEHETTTVLEHQVIKCTITGLNAHEVTVQLRYQQFNLRPFATDSLWNLEPDLIDSGFVTMYRGLFEWAGTAAGKRGMLLSPGPLPDPLATRPPAPPPWQTPPPTPPPPGRGVALVGSKLPSPEGEGPGVGLPRGREEKGSSEIQIKPGAYGEPFETTDRDRWKYLKGFARSMRKQPTKAEAAMWELLRNRRFQGVKFRRQHAINDYIVDFVSLEHRLAIEIDGDTHTEQPEYDKIRTEYLANAGFQTVRFSNEEVLTNEASVLEKLGQALLHGPTPLPFGGGVAFGGGVGVAFGDGARSEIQQGEAGMTKEQHHILQKILASPDYFLLWGPPGTGKTSVMLRALAAWVLNETFENLLLLAYTNRAVDEICEALDSIGGDVREHYLRIGSRHATAERFRDQLLNNKISGIQRRGDLRDILDRHRIFVSTVASFSQNDQLLRLKKFHRLVVDEASQLTEPQLIGLLPRFDHFTLIGDHRQLPAVTAQRPELTRVTDPDLLAIGLTDLRDSYFERLYRRCVTEGQHAHFACLSRQGRMHADIMAFPNEHFYDGFLQTLDERQTSAADPGEFSERTDWEKMVADHRVLFLSVPPEETFPGQKTNRAEAALAARLTAFFQKMFAEQGREWRPTQSLGIITPWRAQIAQLRETLAAAGLDPETVTIDTVERYQGGARDVVILSCCVNSPTQLASLVNLSAENVDRKLNVALTRARHRVVVLGNAEILKLDERYRAFVERYGAEIAG